MIEFCPPKKADFNQKLTFFLLLERLEPIQKKAVGISGALKFRNSWSLCVGKVRAHPKCLLAITTQLHIPLSHCVLHNQPKSLICIHRIYYSTSSMVVYAQKITQPFTHFHAHSLLYTGSAITKPYNILL